MQIRQHISKSNWGKNVSSVTLVVGVASENLKFKNESKERLMNRFSPAVLQVEGGNIIKKNKGAAQVSGHEERCNASGNAPMLHSIGYRQGFPDALSLASCT